MQCVYLRCSAWAGWLRDPEHHEPAGCAQGEGAVLHEEKAPGIYIHMIFTPHKCIIIDNWILKSGETSSISGLRLIGWKLALEADTYIIVNLFVSNSMSEVSTSISQRWRYVNINEYWIRIKIISSMTFNRIKLSTQHVHVDIFKSSKSVWSYCEAQLCLPYVFW